jgi:hypothetical protein
MNTMRLQHQDGQTRQVDPTHNVTPTLIPTGDATMSTSSLLTTSGPLDEPWVSRGFLKDGKFRTTERYWRDPRDLASQMDSSAQMVARIFPDALTWRKHLRLIRTLVTDYHDLPFQWIITESAVELMDHRNQSLQEAAAPQERNVVQRLIRQTMVSLRLRTCLCVKSTMSGTSCIMKRWI